MIFMPLAVLDLHVPFQAGQGCVVHILVIVSEVVEGPRPPSSGGDQTSAGQLPPVNRSVL